MRTHVVLGSLLWPAKAMCRGFFYSHGGERNDYEHCPVRFDPQTHLAPDTLRFADHLVYLAHLVYYRKHTDRTIAIMAIKAAYVREIVGKNLYPRVIRLAQEIGLIEITGRAVVKSCRLWDIGERFRGEYQKREITDWLLSRRIQRARREHRQEVGSKGKHAGRWSMTSCSDGPNSWKSQTT